MVLSTLYLVALQPTMLHVATMEEAVPLAVVAARMVAALGDLAATMALATLISIATRSATTSIILLSNVGTAMMKGVKRKTSPRQPWLRHHLTPFMPHGTPTPAQPTTSPTI
jgi:hypothetical protein